VLERFKGKVIAVAGGSGGIGSAVSRRLAAEGAAVLVGDVDVDAAAQTAEAIAANGGCAAAFGLDIADEASVAAFVRAAVQAYGGLDGIHVNAVDSSRSERDIDPVSADMADYDHMMRVNLRGYFLCTRHAIPALLQRGGAILYTGSGAAYAGMPVKPVYAMVKSGIGALARHVARRYGPQGIRCNVVSPGLMVHPAVEAKLSPERLAELLKDAAMPRPGRPEDIAAMAALLLSDDGAYVTGQVICVDGGATLRA
jgi:NAD(P)-dependent dehydrogenase (short-subunit alcohol dehydrogenase family)